MKNFTIKNYSGEKMLIANDLSKVDVKELYKQAKSLGIPFAVKKEIGVQIWGLFTVCEYLGIKDSSKFFN